MNIDWKDALSHLAESGNLPEGEQHDNIPADSATKQNKKDTLHIAKEKKGRNGKTATIVYGFTCSDEELEKIASNLKHRLGVGGSARGGEILIQGDRADSVRQILKSEGFNLK